MRALVLFLGLAAAAASEGHILLTHDGSQGATGYRIHYGLASGIYMTTVDTGPSKTVSLGGLKKGRIYYFAATAYNAAGESGYSNEVKTRIHGR